jgi:ribose 5-phosphate isomerase RpiB
MTKELKEKIMNHLAEAEFEMFNFMDEIANHDYEEIREELKKVMEKLYKAN